MLDAQVPAAGTYQLQIKAVNVNLTEVDKFQLYTPDFDMPTRGGRRGDQSARPGHVSSCLHRRRDRLHGVDGDGRSRSTGIDTMSLTAARGQRSAAHSSPIWLNPVRVSTSLTAFTP